jgi:hypothetical protein
MPGNFSAMVENVVSMAAGFLLENSRISIQ